MTRSRADWYDKANSYSQAWAERFGVPPSVHNVALGLAVAEHETRCGDAWPGDHNWGACTKGGLSQAQRRLLQVAGVHPVLEPAIARQASEGAATETLVAGGQPPAEDQSIHVDSSPTAGAYFTFFGKFPTDVLGAGYFIHVLADQRQTCKSILETAETFYDHGCVQLAGAMYRTHYYTGFHDPHQPGGDSANIGDYAKALLTLQPSIATALDGWTPGAEVAAAEPENIDPSLPLGLQQALNQLGADPVLAEDGIVGPKTKAALARWQGDHGLAPSGTLNPTTIAALRAALA